MKLADKYYTEYLQKIIDEGSKITANNLITGKQMRKLKEVCSELEFGLIFERSRFNLDYNMYREIYSILRSFNFSYDQKDLYGDLSTEERLNFVDKLEPDFYFPDYVFLLDFDIFKSVLSRYNEIEKYANMKNDTIYQRLKKMKTRGELQQTIIDKIEDCYVLLSIIQFMKWEVDLY